MASFNDLPIELVHNVAHHLAPTGCADSKRDILAFRAVERRTWLVANKVAFKYMTLYIQDPARCTKLGTFGQEANLDPHGCDIRSLVQEVEFLMPPDIHIREFSCRAGKGDETLYKQKAHRIFLHMLQKEEQELNAKERTAFQHYWKLCIQPYMVGMFSSKYIEQRIAKDLENFPNMRTMSVSLGHHILNTSSSEWDALEKIGIADRIYNKSKERFYPLPDGASLNESLSLDYSSDRTLKTILMRALPSSVIKLKCNGGQDELIPNPFMSTTVTQITEFDAGVDQSMTFFLGYGGTTCPSFPNLQTLRLRSDLTKEEQYGLWGDNCYMIQGRIAVIPQLLSNLSSLAHLETLHINGYFVGMTGFIAILKFAACHGLTLILENIMVLRVLQTHPPSVAEIRNFWPGLFNIAWSYFPQYMSSGQIHLEGAITCVSVPLYPDKSCDTVVEHSLDGSLMDKFQELMHTSGNADSFYAEMVERSDIKEVEKKVDWNTARVIEMHDGWK